MALQPKKTVTKCECTCKKDIADILKRLEVLEAIPVSVPKKVEGKSIHNVEQFNGEVATPVEEYSGMKMGFEDKLISMKNAIAILPPNLMVDNKHTQNNIGAICGFIVTDEMYDILYGEAA